MIRKTVQISLLSVLGLCAMKAYGGPTVVVPPPTNPPVSNTAPPKSGLNTNIYEKESSEKTFSSKVKMVREVQGSSEVLFDSKPGIFTFDEAQQAPLMQAKKDGSSVTVRYNEDNSHILSVQVLAAPKAAAPASGMMGNSNGK